MRAEHDARKNRPARRVRPPFSKNSFSPVRARASFEGARRQDATMTSLDAEATDAAFRECYELVKEMTNIYASDEDAKKVRAIGAHFEDAQTIRAGREEHMMAQVKEMSRRVKVAERKAVLPAAAHVARERALKLDAEKRAAGEYLNAMEREARALEIEQEELQNRRGEIKLHKQKLDTIINEEIPATKREVSLYAHISNIAWHYEERDRVVGRVNARSARDVRKIDMPLRPGNEFRVANALWEMMD